MAVQRQQIVVERLFQNYKMLIDRVDTRCHEIESTLSGHMACHRGCSNCCMNISLFPVEAIGLRLSLETLEAEEKEAIVSSALHAKKEGACPLLDGDGACRLYGDRPLICRTHGLPILFEDEAGVRKVDFCPDNFGGLTSLSGDLMLDVDALNQMLTAVNAAFCESLFQGHPPFDRVTISDALQLELDV